MTSDDATPPHGFRLPGMRRRVAPGERDDTTRYLCAAAHLDSDFADDAIREFLVEDTRPVPSSPGVDAVAVLAEAVAARTRRKLRDIGLIVLMVGLLFVVSVGLLIGWLVLAFLMSLPAIISAMRSSQLLRKVVVNLVGALVVAGLLVYAATQLLGSSAGSQPFDVPSYYAVEESTPVAPIIIAIAIVAAMLAVLLADRFAVWRHLSERFWPNRLTRLTPWIQNRAVFQFSPDRQLTQLGRYANRRPTMARNGPSDGEPVPLVVYRDFKPFVGAGTPEEPWSIAVPLETLPDAEPTMELTTESLYAGIRKEISSLRAASELTPGQRLGQLDLGELVIVSADELIDHLAEPSADDFLKQPGVAPFTMIHRERAEAIKANPLEWARYYHCYQIETWDRDLVVTVFVHVAVGPDALYVEWTPCVLRPIKKSYQEIDKMPRSPLRPAGRAVLDLLALPVGLPLRLIRTLSVLRPLPQDRGLVLADTYGSSSSLRELAADHQVHNYFQLADVERYLKMMESRLVLAVSRMMRAAGFSPASFDERAASVVNNNVQIGGSVTGDVVVGTGNKVGNTATPSR